MSSVQHHELQEIADHTMASIADQLLLPQSHYIDVLLDLLVVAPSPIVRSAIADRLSEIRFVSMVATDEVRADLYGIVAISDFSDAASDDLGVGGASAPVRLHGMRRRARRPSVRRLTDDARDRTRGVFVMLIHSSTTFDIAVASHRARVASATTHRHVETPRRSPCEQRLR